MLCFVFFLSAEGEALLESCTAVDFVYCSPSLRCVQTAQHILQGRTTSSLTFVEKPQKNLAPAALSSHTYEKFLRICHICYGHEAPMDECASEIVMGYFIACGIPSGQV